MPVSENSKYDVVIVGAGHNALVSACYLAKAGLSVLILEKQDHLGGASVSTQIFPGVEAWPSEYAYLVSLFPDKIIKDLDLNFATRQRSVASYTPSGDKALLVSNTDENLTKQSFLEFAGEKEYENYKKFLELEYIFAKKIWPTVLEKLSSKEAIKKSFTSLEEIEAWNLFVENPLGQAIEKYFSNDVVRGLVFTDAKIGVLTYPEDPSFLQNRTFLYHIIGNGTGEWQVPVGGMGALIKELEKKALASGVAIKTSSEVKFIKSETESVTVEFTDLKNKQQQKVISKFLLCGATPSVLAKLLGKSEKPEDTGSVFKINMLLKRLPKVKSPLYSAEQAFAGTFHVNEGYETMKQSSKDARENKNPLIFTGEMYCHTLTDDSILSPELNKKGYHTLTFFGLDMPYSLFKENNEKMKAIVLKGYLKAINNYLMEPIEDCLALDKDGNPCLDAKSPMDLENELGMTEGNIFHGNLSWFFKETDKSSWGVETDYKNIFICGAGAKRGGGVSGIPGHNAAMAVLEKINNKAKLI
jgi:phytoene dehydrogenase-like protein